MSPTDDSSAAGRDEGATHRPDPAARFDSTHPAGRPALRASRARTVTRADLLDGIRRSCPTLSRPEARDLLEMVISEITESLIRGETVKLHAFARFKIRTKTARPGRNPRTGTPAPISPRRVVSFAPSPVLLAAINRPRG